MGRITIFSIEECNFCRRAKAALSSRGIPYTDVNIETYHDRRSDMISLTDKLTVPQIFFNEEHVGGCEELLQLLARWEGEIAKDDSNDKTPYDRYVRLVESAPSPKDARLAIPEGNGGVEKNNKTLDIASSRIKEIVHIGENEYTTVELTKLLVRRMPRESLTYWGCMYYNVFRGSRGVTALQRIFHLKSKEEAIELGTTLQSKGYITHVTKDHAFNDNGYYFRLQPFQTPNILNSFLIWNNEGMTMKVADKDKDDDGKNNDNATPIRIIHRLSKLWGKLESRHLNQEGMVDHSTLRNDDSYWKFEAEVCEIQRISLRDDMVNDYTNGDDDATKMAFVINVYNLMIKYAFVKLGIPSTSSSRSSFFSDILINIGDDLFSFNDLEHGILRANTRHPYQVSKPFGIRDSRRMLSLQTLDPRIHFALNCGAKSCPPVKRYTPESIQEELRLAAMAFCESEENVSMEEEKSVLYLSKILYWYMSDFVASKEDLPKKIAEYLRGKKKEKLEKLQKGHSRVTVDFLEYDWSSNDINFITYGKGNLSSKRVFPHSTKNPPPQIYEKVTDGDF